MVGKKILAMLAISSTILVGCSQHIVQEATDEKEMSMSFEKLAQPSFTNVSVHDPSVIKVLDTYYVFGSHLAGAKSTDLMNWTLVDSGVKIGNVFIPNVLEEMKEALDWAQTDTFWAPDVIELADGRFYMYYNTCRGDSPLSSLGIAVADEIEGPYEDLGLILKSGMWGQVSEDGRVYDATIHPNVVDPDLFFDKEGRLWMMYGSYSGGIFIMEMDSQTGFPLPEQGYGKKILGGNHARIEAPYVLYSPESEYYYLFLSFGGLDASGGYNIRVARSKTPDGPYLDASGQDMIKCKGKNGSFFDDIAISPYGSKLMGNFIFNTVEGEPGKKISSGYVSPGHNSAFYDAEKEAYYLIFHSRFTMRGEQHEVRVHPMYLNEDDWLVVAPHRY
ncbi:MAG: family 43 glycosylhydrolase, partial [Turicibacter sp.]